MENRVRYKLPSFKWQSQYTPSNELKTFESDYIFDEGFESHYEAYAYVKSLGANPNCFRFVRFRDMYYAIYMHVNIHQIVVTLEHVYIHNLMEYEWDIYQIGTSDLSFIPQIVGPYNAGLICWQQGVYSDLKMIDKSATVYYPDERICDDKNEKTNTLITFGSPFFYSFINTKSIELYEHVILFYCNPWEHEMQMQRVYQCRDNDIAYYNPLLDLICKDREELEHIFEVRTTHYNNFLFPDKKDNVVNINDFRK